MKIFEVKNQEDGTEVFIIIGTAGKFHVIFRDTDAGEVIGVTIFADKNKAIDYAESIYSKSNPTYVYA